MELWVERHRPSRLANYVWRDADMRALVEGWIAQGALPHCLFAGAPGTGKTTLAKVLFRELAIPDSDILYINASRERGIEAFQDRVIRFVDAWAMNESGIKYVLLDEADKMTQHAQGLLRGELETYANVCRFVMTANYPQKIIPALHSRLQTIHFGELDQEQFVERLADVLDKEKVDYQPEILLAYVHHLYPDLRKCIGMLQQNTRNGVLVPMRTEEGVRDYLKSAAEMFKKGRYLEGRNLIISQIRPEEYDDFYRFLYQHLSLFGGTQDQQDDALLVIRKGLVHHSMVADPEINASATLVELTRIANPNI